MLLAVEDAAGQSVDRRALVTLGFVAADEAEIHVIFYYRGWSQSVRRLAKTRDLLRHSGKALPIAEILKLLGKPLDKKHRISLAGTLSSYARKGRVFTKTGPNIFGLIEFGPIAEESEEELPAEFGSMTQ